MQVLWHGEARREAEAAADFYFGQRSGLEKRFINSLEDAISRIALRPLAHPVVVGNIRRCRLAIFPYGVIYRVQSETVQVIAIMHLRQAPGYWRKRL